MVFALFVGNLHPEVTEVMLAEKFRPAGQILSIYVCRDKKTGFSRRFAYVNFWHRAEAERALELFNSELLLDRPMRVTWSTWKATMKTTNMGNIFLKNLDKSINSMALFDTFSVFGRILWCKVVEPKGYGYIQYEAAEAAALAIEKLSGKLLNGRQVTIEHFKSHKEREAEARPSCQHQASKLYIKNLDYSIDDKCLNTVFEQFGTITSAKVMRQNGRSRGFGFVRFSTSREATYAKNVMNGRMWGRRWVYVGVAQGRQERQDYLANQNFPKMLSMEFNTPQTLHQLVLPACYMKNTPAVGTSSAVVSVPLFWAASVSGQCPSLWDGSLSGQFPSLWGSFCSGQCSSIWDGSLSGQFPSLWGSFCSGQCPSIWDGSLSGQFPSLCGSFGSGKCPSLPDSLSVVEDAL